MSAGAPESQSERLERALDVFVQHAQTGGDPTRLLEQHGDLRDLLEPMLEAGDEGGDGAQVGADPGLLGDYRLVREIGRGGMGIVYEAWQRSLDRPVALKVLSPALVASPSAVARFRREAAAVGRLRHPSIVEVHGFGSDGQRHWFAMGLVDGEPLTACRERFAPPQAAAGLVAQVLDALQHAHAAGLVHRDVKPGNVLVRADGTAVLTDFGLAHDAELPSVTTDGGFLGTLDYASPEQVQGRAIDVRTDVWSVGVLLYELLAGERPFARPSATATMKAILDEEPAPLRRRSPAVPADLAAIVGRATQKDPARRYATAAAFLADVRAWMAGGVIEARAAGLLERGLRWVRREPWRATTALVVVVAAPLLMAGSAYLWANAPRIAAAAAAEQRERRERALTTAWISLADGDDVAPGLRALDSLPPGPADLEVAIAAAALLERDRRTADALARLDAFGSDPVARLVRSIVADEDAQQQVDFAKVTGRSAIECFALGAFAYSRFQTTGDKSLHPVAARHMGLAVAMSPAPRSAFLFWWMVTTARARDEAAFAAAFAAYEHHFPDSDGLRLACVLCASVLPVERGLQILAGVDYAQNPRWQFARGLLLDRAGKRADAEQAYRLGLAADPKNVQGWLNLAAVHEAQRSFGPAATALEQAVGIAPDNAEAWNRLGVARFQQDLHETARTAFERAIAAGPELWRPRFNFGLLLREIGDDTAALAAFEAAAQIAPTQPETHVFVARMLRKLGRQQEAMLADARALQCSPRDGKQQSVVAIGLADVGLHDAAIDQATRASNASPDDPLVWARLAEVLLGAPKVDAPRALAAAQRAEGLAKGANARGLWLLARAEAATGAVPAAIARLETLLAAGDKVPAAVRRLAEDELARLRAPK